MEIIVVDGNSQDRTLSLIKNSQRIAEQDGISFKILNDEGKGLGYARQLIVENAQGEYVFWVDSDSIIPSNLIKVQLEFLKNNPSVGISISLVLPTGKKLIERLQGYTWFLPTLNSMHTKRAPYTTMQGSASPLRVLQEFEGFNVALRDVGEDSDLIRRLRIKGYSVLANPRAVVHHHMKKSCKEFLEHGIWYGRTRRKRPVGTLIKKCISRPLIYLALTPLAFQTFRDPACLLVPFHNFVWNLILLVSHFGRHH